MGPSFRFKVQKLSKGAFTHKHLHQTFQPNMFDQQCLVGVDRIVWQIFSINKFGVHWSNSGTKQNKWRCEQVQLCYFKHVWWALHNPKIVWPNEFVYRILQMQCEQWKTVSTNMFGETGPLYIEKNVWAIPNRKVGVVAAATFLVIVK